MGGKYIACLPKNRVWGYLWNKEKAWSKAWGEVTGGEMSSNLHVYNPALCPFAGGMFR